MKGQTDICWKVAFTTFDILRGQGSNFTNPSLFQKIGTVKDKTSKYISGHFQPDCGAKSSGKRQYFITTTILK